MQAAMDRLARLIARRRALVLGIWAALLVVSVPFFLNQTTHLTAGGFGVPGSQSQFVADAIERFPDVQSETLIFVFDNRARAGAEELDAAIDRTVAAVRGVEGVSVSPAFEQAARSQADADVVLMPLVVSGTADQTIDAAADLREQLGLADQDADAAVPIHMVGQQALWTGMQDLSKEDLEKAELVGFPLVFIVLLLVFGSAAAALLPLSLGFVAVTITGAVIYFLSQLLAMSVFVTNMASMLGIGVAVDYSLFILARYREEIARGLPPERAREVAMRTSGLAVAFSGVTVLIALAGLFLVNSKVMHSMAVGAIVVVSIAMLGAVTLLPALIGLLGHRAYTPGRYVGRVVAALRRKPRAGEEAFWTRWTHTLMARPALFATLATVFMLVIAFPALNLKWGTGAVAQLPKDYETRVGVDLAAERAGPGAGGPVLVIGDYGKGTVDLAQVERFAAAVRGLDNVSAMSKATVTKDGHLVLLSVTPRTDPESDATWRLVQQLRDPAGPGRLLQGASVKVGGPAAQDHDHTRLISGSLWKVALFVMVFSYLVLLVLLRSLVLPLKAVAMNLLSVAAAYGVLVVVFQYGWFDSILGFDHLGYVNALTPPLILAIVFGLSMDYEVFLLSRIKERYHATHDNRAAVAGGLADSAKTISSAAIIMVLVFTIFAFTGLPQVKEIGVGLATAIFLDATVVRLILVPATMELLGDWNWWLPKRLDRLLPAMDFEGSGPPPPPPSEPPEPALAAR